MLRNGSELTQLSVQQPPSQAAEQLKKAIAFAKGLKVALAAWWFSCSPDRRLCTARAAQTMTDKQQAKEEAERMAAPTSPCCVFCDFDFWTQVRSALSLLQRCRLPRSVGERAALEALPERAGRQLPQVNGTRCSLYGNDNADTDTIGASAHDEPLRRALGGARDEATRVRPRPAAQRWVGIPLPLRSQAPHRGLSVQDRRMANARYAVELPAG
jgi:hypothetical protein